MKELIEELKIKKVSNLLEKMQNGNLNDKIYYYKKIEKLQITKEIGILLIRSSIYDYNLNDGNDGISSSLIELCFKNYYSEYSIEIKKIFKKLNKEAQDRVIFLLSSIDNESSLDLYVDLLLKYYSNVDFLPISNLFERPNTYNMLFPKLFKTLKFKKTKNNVLIIINDFLNMGIVPQIDLNKNKKLIEDAIIRVFEEALTYKFTNTSQALLNEEYLDLRYFLEICVNIEMYISSKKTEEYLNKLFKRNDNQLKLFILENYIKKNKDISKLKLDKIARDDLSRYPLYDMLKIYKKEKFMPKKYLNTKALSKSDFYINFMIHTKYKELPVNYRFYKELEIDGYKYYAYKFKYTYKYENRINDYITDYLINQVGINKYNNIELTRDFIGIAGGYNLKNDPSLVEFNHNRLIYLKKETYETNDEILNKLIQGIKNDINYVKEYNLRQLKEEEIIYEEPKKKFSFSYILIFLFLIFLSLLITCVIYAYDPSLIKVNNKTTNYISSKLTNSDSFKEIDGREIYNQEQSEYYVLLYKKEKNNKNKYYTYINTFIKNNITIYYVNLNDEKNNFLFESNDLNFTLEEDRLLKVNEKDFEYYVDGKNNILNEMKIIVNKLKNK